MRRVLVLNQYALPRSEPGGTRHIELFSRLEEWEFVIVAGNRNHYTQRRFTVPDQANFRTVRVPILREGSVSRLLTWTSWSAGALTTAIRLGRPDVVYASTPHLLAPLLGIFLSRAWRIPLVVEVRDLWPESFVAAGLLSRESLLYRALRALEKISVRSADHLVVVTSGWEGHLEQLGVDLSGVTVVPNGADPPDLELHKEGRRGIRATLGVRDFAALFAGAHGPKDGLNYILKAAEELPEVDFYLVGDGPMKAQTVARAARQGLGNVRFLDPVSKDALPQLLAAADVGLHTVAPLPVFALGMSPNKVFDYMASGLPVVSNSGEGVRSIVDVHDCGWNAENDELASTLSAAYRAGPRERARRGANGRRAAETTYSRAASAKLLAELLDQACREAGGG